MRYTIALFCTIVLVVVVLMLPLAFILDLSLTAKGFAVFNAATWPMVTHDAWQWARSR